MSINIQKLISVFKETKGVKFVAFPYTNQKNELAKRLINIGTSYESACKEDLETLNSNEIVYEANEKYSKADFDLAMLEKKQSVQNSLNQDNNDAHSVGQKEAYITITTGVKYHVEKQKLYIFGTAVRTIIIEKGEYKEVKSSAKTLAKKDIEKKLRTSKYRNFLVENVSGDIKANGDIIELN